MNTSQPLVEFLSQSSAPVAHWVMLHWPEEQVAFRTPGRSRQLTLQPLQWTVVLSVSVSQPSSKMPLQSPKPGKQFHGPQVVLVLQEATPKGVPAWTSIAPLQLGGGDEHVYIR